MAATHTPNHSKQEILFGKKTEDKPLVEVALQGTLHNILWGEDRAIYGAFNSRAPISERALTTFTGTGREPIDRTEIYGALTGHSFIDRTQVLENISLMNAGILAPIPGCVQNNTIAEAKLGIER